jgi:hypothetical protein
MLKGHCLLILVLAVFTSVAQNNKTSDLATEIWAIEYGLLPAIRVNGSTVTSYNLYDRMEHYKVPVVSIAVVNDGVIRWAKGYGI